MSNYIRLTHITDKAGNSGFTFADDYGTTTQFIDGTPEDDLDLLKFVEKNADSIGEDLIQFCNENQKGIEINDTMYSYDKIRTIINP